MLAIAMKLYSTICRKASQKKMLKREVVGYAEAVSGRVFYRSCAQSKNVRNWCGRFLTRRWFGTRRHVFGTRVNPEIAVGLRNSAAAAGTFLCRNFSRIATAIRSKFCVELSSASTVSVLATNCDFRVNNNAAAADRDKKRADLMPVSIVNRAASSNHQRFYDSGTRISSGLIIAKNM